MNIQSSVLLRTQISDEVNSDFTSNACLICPYTSLFNPRKSLSFTNADIKVVIGAPRPPHVPYQTKLNHSEDPRKRKRDQSNALSKADIETRQHHEEIVKRISKSIERVRKTWLEKADVFEWWNYDHVENFVKWIDGPEVEELSAIQSINDNGFVATQCIVLAPGGSWIEWEKELCFVRQSLDVWPFRSPNDFVYLCNERKSHSPILWKSLPSLFHRPHLNLSKDPLLLNFQEERTTSDVTQRSAFVYIPPLTGFCVSQMSHWDECGLDALGQSIGGWDIITIDPPWPNTSSSRSKSYESIDIYDMFNFQLPLNAESKRTLICVWVTNKPKFHRFVKNKLFPSWGIDCTTVVTWYWVKITGKEKNSDLRDSGGEPVWDISSTHRRCYEGLIMGFRATRDETPPSPLPSTVFLSTTMHHSRKPFLIDLLRPYINKREEIRGFGGIGLRVLEMFGRGLPDHDGDDFVMCVGNEPLLFNYCYDRSHT